VLFVHHPSSLEHDTGSHPERAARIPAIERALAERDWLGLERVQAPPVAEETLLAVHPPAHVDRIRRLAERGGGAIDFDTVVSAGSYAAALHAAGGAAHLVDRLVGPTVGPRLRAGFCALRPPGHHAEHARAMGFCLFNNVAVAARHARDAHGVERVLVVDWDVHHGNGTEEIFESDPGVLFVSVHQSPLYPGTGSAASVGAGEGLGYTVNLPVPPGSGDEVFVSHVEHLVRALAAAYRPGLVLVSAGYDAHRDDPLADCRVSEAGFAAMAGSVRRMCGELGDVPLGLVLEGGYELDALARSVVATLEVVATPEAPELGSTGDTPLHPLTVQAAHRAASFWPDLRTLAVSA
jgi:acetoin utilization deacetylase AcuC-like enzyme